MDAAAVETMLEQLRKMLINFQPIYNDSVIEIHVTTTVGSNGRELVDVQYVIHEEVK